MHPWDVSVRQAIDIQKNLSSRVRCKGSPTGIKTIAGVDIAIRRNTDKAYCGIIIFEYPSLKLLSETYSSDTLKFPYVPGLLSFREGPLFLKTWELVGSKPDLIVFDGQGIAHPRRLGIASHMGLLLDIPAIGCAKSRLFGSYTNPGPSRGSMSYLYDDNNCKIGVVIRTRDNVSPVFVSPGHNIGIDESAEIIMACAVKYRIPVPTRTAHVKVGEYKNSFSA
jgi:deoxyribonuclease V